MKEGGRGQPPVLQSTLQFESRVIFHHTILRGRLLAVQRVAKAELNAGIQFSAKTQRREPPNSGRELALDAMFWGVKDGAIQLHWRLESTTLHRLRCGDFGPLFSLLLLLLLLLLLQRPPPAHTCFSLLRIWVALHSLLGPPPASTCWTSCPSWRILRVRSISSEARRRRLAAELALPAPQHL